MAVELAKLLIKADSSELIQAEKALENLSKQAFTAEKATDSLTRTVRESATPFNVLSRGTKTSTEGFDRVVSRTRAVSNQLNVLTGNVNEGVYSLTYYKKAIEGTTRALSKLGTGLHSNDLTKFLYGAQTGQSYPVDINKDILSVIATANDNKANAKSLSRFYVGNIAAQFQDIGVTAAMGMNPLTIALQQGTQLSEILKSMEKPLVGLAAAFKSLISPISLMTVGIVALVSAGIQLVDWANVFRSASGSLGDALQWVADNLTGLTVALTTGAVTYAAITGGVSAFSGALLTLTGVFSKVTLTVYSMSAALLSSPVFWGATAVLAVAAAVGYLAQKFGLLDGVLAPVKNFIQGWANDLKGIGDNVEDLKEKWSKVEDYVENAVEKSKLEASVLGKSREEALLMKNTFDVLNKAKQEGLNIEEDSLYYIKAINRARSLTQVQLATEEAKAAHERSESYKKLNEDLRLQVFQIQKETEWLALGNAELDRMKNQFDVILNAQKDLNGLTDEEAEHFKNYADEITKAKRNLEFEKTKKGFEDQATSIKRNKDYLFLMGQEAAVAKSKMEALAEAKEKGFSKEQTEHIVSQAESVGLLQYEYDNLESAIQFADSTTSGFFKDMRNGLMEGKNAWEAFGDAVLNVVDAIADAIIDIGAQYLVRAVAGSFMSSSGIPSGNTLGTGLPQPTGTLDLLGPTSSGFFANGGVFNRGLTKFAKGGTFTDGIFNSPTLFKFAKGSKFGLMGEAGPEAVMPLKRGPDGSLGVQIHGNETAGGDVIVNVINNSTASARTQEKETANGKQIDVIIDQVVGQKMGDMGSATNRALVAQNNKRLISR